jgi:hypothetical protein
MRRILLVMATMVAAVLVASGVALAAKPTPPGPIHFQRFDNLAVGPILINDATASTEGEVVVGQASPYPSGIVVPEGLQAGGFPAGSRILAMDVFLEDFRHTNPDDVDVLLVGPSGKSTILMSDAGGNHSTDFGGVPDVSLRFTDNRGVSLKLPDEDQLSTQPEGYLPANYRPSDIFPAPAPAPKRKADLSVFEGTNPNGPWRLYVVDDNPDNVGTIRGFSLFIFAEAPPEQLP